MPTLADTLSKSIATAGAQPAGSMTAQPQILGTQSLVNQISTAAAGKQQPVGNQGPQRSNLGEQVQRQQFDGVKEQQQKAQQLDAAIATNRAIAQEKEQNLNEEQLDEQQLGMRTQMLDKQLSILNDYSQGTRQLDLQKDKAKLEQLGMNMRLANSKYLQTLQQEATRSGLLDDARFTEELKRTVFADEEELLRDDLEFRALINADAREFNEMLGNMDIETAMSIANAENRAANQRGMWDGVSSAASGAVQAYGMSKGSGTPTPNSDAFASKPQAAPELFRDNWIYPNG